MKATLAAGEMVAPIRERFLRAVAGIQARGRSHFIWHIVVPYFIVARALWTFIFDGLLAPEFSWPVVLSELFWDSLVGGVLFGGAIALWTWHVLGLNRWPNEPEWWAKVLPPVKLRSEHTKNVD
jgi:hypothetical protein